MACLVTRPVNARWDSRELRGQEWGLSMVGTESRNRNLAQMGQTQRRELEGYCGS